MFPLFAETKYDATVIKLIVETLTSLNKSLDSYFPSLDVKSYDWVRDPFLATASAVLNLYEEEELAEIRTNRSLQINFPTMTTATFWISVANDYPHISQKAIEVLLHFSTSYLCELGFSSLTEIKCKKRSCLLTVEEELRVCLSNIRPRIKIICENHQTQVSH